MTLRVGIAGRPGRMGRLLAEGLARHGLLDAGGIGRDGDIAALAAAADIVIDFTHASSVRRHAAALAAAGRAWVLGTSGLGSDDEAAVADAAHRIPIVHAANFSPAVTLMLDLARRMAAALPGTDYDAEILDMHHRQKVDAPSGTALALGRAVAQGRAVDLPDAMQSGRHGQTGARPPGAIGFAALRGGQVVGEHTLLFAGPNEHLSLTHRAFDRRVFADGALRAAQWLHARPPGLFGMRDVLGLDPG